MTNRCIPSPTERPIPFEAFVAVPLTIWCLVAVLDAVGLEDASLAAMGLGAVSCAAMAAWELARFPSLRRELQAVERR